MNHPIGTTHGARRVIAAGALVSAFVVAGCAMPSTGRVLADDGNMLFYNTPAAADLGGDEWIGYLTRDGDVMITALESPPSPTEPLLVHSYREQVDPAYGRADDHAAPSLAVNPESATLLVATAYHGTDLLIYSVDPSSGDVAVVQRLEGRFSYPRFVGVDGALDLIARLQPDDDTLRGDLVLLSSDDGFSTTRTVLESEPGTVIYAGDVTVSGADLLVAYSVHSYAEDRLIGLQLVAIDHRTAQLSWTCDLSGLLGDDAFSNRPTGIGYDGSRIMIGTAWSGETATREISQSENFGHRNTVAVLTGVPADCGSFSSVETREVSMPYYQTGVAVDDSLRYLYFDEDTAHASFPLDACLNTSRALYPQFTRSGLIFATMNGPYSIRDFDNSIEYCPVGAAPSS